MPRTPIKALVAFGVAAVLALGAVASGSTGARVHGPLIVSLDVSHPRARVPADFLGLSFEARDLPRLAKLSRTGDLPHLLRSLAPAVVRFGGITADTEVAWTSPRTPRPAWAHRTVTPTDLARLGRLLHAARARLLLTVNLAHFDPSAAADEVASAADPIGSRLAAVEPGNEPDYYGRHGYRPMPWTFDDYRAEIRRYRAAIRSMTPEAQLAGPDATSTARLGWLRLEAHQGHPALLTAHYYPLGCTEGGPAPTIPHLLSAGMRAGESARMQAFARLQRVSGIPLRVDETNNVSCGGKPGVSDTFAAALWAVDYLARAMEGGVAGVNLHDTLICRGYSPLCATSAAALERGSLTANPEWYALLLARALVADRPVRAAVAPLDRQVSVHAFLSPHGALHVVVVDDAPPGTRAARLLLHVPAGYASGTVTRLVAPSPAATRGVTLGGSAVAPDGSWRAARALPRVAARKGVVSVALPASSAALLTLARP